MGLAYCSTTGRLAVCSTTGRLAYCSSGTPVIDVDYSKRTNNWYGGTATCGAGNTAYRLPSVDFIGLSNRTRVYSIARLYAVSATEYREAIHGTLYTDGCLGSGGSFSGQSQGTTGTRIRWTGTTWMLEQMQSWTGSAETSFDLGATFGNAPAGFLTFGTASTPVVNGGVTEVLATWTHSGSCSNDYSTATVKFTNMNEAAISIGTWTSNVFQQRIGYDKDLVDWIVPDVPCTATNPTMEYGWRASWSGSGWSVASAGSLPRYTPQSYQLGWVQEDGYPCQLLTTTSVNVAPSAPGADPVLDCTNPLP